MWNELSLREKSELMKLGIKNGIRSLNTIKDTYNKYGNGGYISSPYIRNKITKWEGTSMKSNTPFKIMDKYFNDSIPSNIRSKMSQEELDALYSYAYNVGTGNFKKRVLPSLNNLYNGNGSIQDVQNAMWAKNDNKLRGLRNRRNVERTLFGSAYNSHYQPVTMNNLSNFDSEPNTPIVTPFVKSDIDPVGYINKATVANQYKPLPESNNTTPEGEVIQPLTTYDVFTTLNNMSPHYKLVDPMQPFSSIGIGNI